MKYLSVVLCALFVLSLGGCAAFGRAMAKTPEENAAVLEDLRLKQAKLVEAQGRLEALITEELAKPEPDEGVLGELRDMLATVVAGAEQAAKGIETAETDETIQATVTGFGEVAQMALVLLAGLGVGIPVTVKVVAARWLKALVHTTEVAMPVFTNGDGSPNGEAKAKAKLAALEKGVEDKVAKALSIAKKFG